MEFTSILFLFLFFPAFLFCYFLCKKRNIRNYVLFFFSIIFYAWGEPFYVFLILISILVNYILAILIDKKKNRKLWFILALVFDLGTLLVFKYTDFIINTLNFIPKLNLPLVNLALPIGISFYTFQMVSYIIDVYKKKVKVQRNILYLGCYIVSFPQLIAGPIVRYETIEDELDNRKENYKDTAVGIRRFISGFAKKAILANSLGLIATSILEAGANYYGFIGSWIAMICYTMQIYFDFSGYSDMAIGIGKMLGFNYLENFDMPYISKSITEYWRRWHISLSSWFKDYVYIPLGGNRVSKIKWIRNIFIVWFLTGLWHGASWNFVLWGLYFGVILLIEKIWLKKYLDKAPSAIKHIYTMVLVIVGWVIFRSTNLSEAGNILTSMIGLNGIGSIKLLNVVGLFKIENIIIFIIGILLSFKKINLKNDYVLLLIFIIAIIFLITGSYNPFIYFRF